MYCHKLIAVLHLPFAAILVLTSFLTSSTDSGLVELCMGTMAKECFKMEYGDVWMGNSLSLRVPWGP